jgi:hypothetical protein
MIIEYPQSPQRWDALADPAERRKLMACIDFQISDCYPGIRIVRHIGRAGTRA